MRTTAYILRLLAPASLLGVLACDSGSSGTKNEPDPRRIDGLIDEGAVQDNVYEAGPITLPQTIVSPPLPYDGQSVIMGETGAFDLSDLSEDGPYELILSTEYETVRLPIAPDGSFSGVIRTHGPQGISLPGKGELGLGFKVSKVNTPTGAASTATAVIVHVSEGTLPVGPTGTMVVPDATGQTPEAPRIAEIEGSAGIRVHRDAQHPSQLDLLGWQAVAPGARVLVANHDRGSVSRVMADEDGGFALRIEGEVTDLLLILQIHDGMVSLPQKGYVADYCPGGLCTAAQVCGQALDEPFLYEGCNQIGPAGDNCEFLLPLGYCPRYVCRYDQICGPEAYFKD